MINCDRDSLFIVNTLVDKNNMNVIRALLIRPDCLNTFKLLSFRFAFYNEEVIGCLGLGRGKGNELFWLKYSYQCKCFRIISIPPETEDSDEK